MHFTDILLDYGFLTIFSLVVLSFAAGFIDSVIGGGGLIQLPALLINLPGTALPTLFGTNKIASLTGTGIAAVQYSRRVKFNYKLLLLVSVVAGIASFAGAAMVSGINVNALKPVILVILIVIAIYTFIKKDLGSVPKHAICWRKQMVRGAVMGLIVGFYDGFFGPGTGSFFVLGFVMLLGFDFIEASAYSKVINCMTNIAALGVFIGTGSYLLEIAILMGTCNMAGNFLGSRMALKKGNEFVRLFFLIIVLLMIVRYAYDIYSAAI